MLVDFMNIGLKLALLVNLYSGYLLKFTYPNK